MSILNQQICLKLNRLWFAIDFVSVEKAVSEIFSLNKRTGKPPQLPVDIVYEQNEDGTYDTERLVAYRPVSLEEWLTLPVRDCDLGIRTARQMVRVPTVTICTNFADIPIKKPKFSSDAVRTRDKDTCQVTKRKLAPGEGDIGHDLAKANGGKRTFTNTAYITKELNRMQGTRTFAEMGWHIDMKEPKGSRVFLTVDDGRHESHKHFLHRN